MRSLIHLPCLRYDDATSMRKFYDEVIGHVRSVESMGGKFNSETLAPVLVPLIVDKLPKEVVEKLELELNEEKAKQDCVEVKTVFTFLEQLIRAKESSQPPSPDLKAQAKENPGNRENRSSLTGHKNLPPQHYVQQCKRESVSFATKTMV